MINRVIHTLSNHAGPFDLFNLPRNPYFEPRRLTQAQRTIRELLYLDRDDVYINAMLSALQAYPDIAAFLTDNVQSFDPSRAHPSPVHIEGASFLVDKNMRGKWLDNDVVLPLNLTYTIDYASATLVTLRAEERAKVATTKYTTAGENPEKILHIAWPVSFPFSGPLKLSQVWTDGSRITIRVQPHNFPYAAWVARVSGNPYVNERLHRLLLQEEYFAAEDPVERAAMLALAIVTDDVEPVPIVLPDEQFKLEPRATYPCGFLCDTTQVRCDNAIATCDHVEIGRAHV